MPDEVDTPPVEVLTPPVEVEMRPLDVEVDPPDDELELEMVMLAPLELPPPKKPPEKKPPPKPKPPDPPMTTGTPLLPPELPTATGGGAGGGMNIGGMMVRVVTAWPAGAAQAMRRTVRRTTR